jgi:hypothetical protein
VIARRYRRGRRRHQLRHPAGLNPNKDAIPKENSKCPNGNLIAALTAGRAEPWATEQVAEVCSTLPGRSCFLPANAHLYQLDFLLCATSIRARAFIMTALLGLAGWVGPSLQYVALGA